MGSHLTSLIFASVCLAQATSSGTPEFRFACHTGYTQAECDAQVKQLRRVLATFELTPLDEWTWILVKSEDWAPILRRVGRDPDSPAFTLLENRQTFLDAALFDRRPDRARTLLDKWRLPLDEILPFAVTHELGHALCRERDEQRTNRYAADLRATGRTECRQP
jgi:hypothetical protein